MTEHKAIRVRGSRTVHATNVEDMRTTACGRPCDGWRLEADEVPTCKVCLRKLLGDAER